MTAIRTVIFDLDGTLLDSLDDLTDSVNYALSENGFSPLPRVEVQALLGNGVKALIRGALPGNAGDTDFEKVYQTFHSYYLEHCMDKTRPYEGILPMLADLRERGYRLAIVSNKLDEMVQRLYGRFFSSYVDLAIGEGPGVRRKPCPDGVSLAAQRLGTPLSAAVYVGDSEVDLATAKNARVACLSVLWGFRTREFLVEAGAVHLVDEPAHLPAEVLGLYV